MITRRAFLSALAVLPLVGQWMPKPEAVRDLTDLAFYPPLKHYPHLYPVPGVTYFRLSTPDDAIEEVIAVNDRFYVNTVNGSVYTIDQNTGECVRA